MKIITAPDVGKHHWHENPQSIRRHNAKFATALDARKFPILAKHYPGIMVVGGELACNDDPKGGRHEA